LALFWVGVNTDPFMDKIEEWVEASKG